MPFLETLSDRVILEGAVPVKVKLAEAVRSGDPLGTLSGTWVLSASDLVEQPLLIAGQPGAIGDVITGYMVAVVKVKHTAANKPAVGDKVALTDAGLFQVAGLGLPDVGFVASVDTDELGSTLFLIPTTPHLTVPRS